MKTSNPIGSRIVAFLPTAVVVSVIACGGGPGFPDGGARVNVVSQALQCDDIAQVTVTVAGADISPDIVADLVGSACAWSGTIDPIPVGANRVFTARAYDADEVLRYEGAATGVTIVGGTVSQVTIILQEIDPIDPFDNTAPIIDAVIASTGTLEPGESLDIEVQAHDVDVGDTLAYAWTATGGTFSTPDQAATQWTAPGTEGVQSLTITVTDSENAAADVTVDITVAWSDGSAAVEATFNHWPSVAGIVPSKSLLAAGDTVALDQTASDPDADFLSFAWSDGGGDCTGTFDDPTAEDPSWTAPAVLPATGSCALAVVVEDGRGGTGTGSLTVHLGAAPELEVGDPVQP
jgi:hypothetical protein